MTPRSVEVFFDGECPLCVREINLLRRLDRKQRITFTDITEASFDPGALGMSYAAMMERIRGRLADGTMIEGVEVFRRLYAAVGFGPIVALTRLWGVSHALDLAYELFAKNRLKLTGRCVKDADGTCAIPSRA